MSRWKFGFIGLCCCLGVVIGVDDEVSSDKILKNNDINFLTNRLSSLKSILSAFTQSMTKSDDYKPDLETRIEARPPTKPKNKQETVKSQEFPDLILPFDKFFGQGANLFPDVNNIFGQNTKNKNEISEITIFDPFYNFVPDIIIQPKINGSCCNTHKQCSSKHCTNSGCVKHKIGDKTPEMRKYDDKMELVDKDLLVCVLPGLIVVVTGVEIIRRHNKMVKHARLLSPQYNHIQHC